MIATNLPRLPADIPRLIAHVDAHTDAAETYAAAGRSVAGSAYGVELRTLSAAHHAIARRLEARLGSLGSRPFALRGSGLLDVATLAKGPTDGVPEILRGEIAMIGDLADTIDTQTVSGETRRIVAAVLLHARAHTHRVERFQDAPH